MSESKLRLLYSALDADGSGGIDEAELSAALGRRGCSQAEVSWMVKAIDSGKAAEWANHNFNDPPPPL